jgi:hypothetical protein
LLEPVRKIALKLRLIRLEPELGRAAGKCRRHGHES